MQSNRERSREAARIPFRALSVIIVLALTAAVGFYYAYQARAVRSEAMQHLQTIARMKAGQVSTWRLDRLQDGERLAGDQQVAALVSEWLADSRDEHAALLRDRLLNESLSEGYESLLLADVTGRVLWTPMGQDEVLAEEAIVGVETAAARAKPVLTDLHSSTDSHGVHADIVVPVMSRRPELHVMAVIVMRVSADDFLYPLVDSRPNERGTAETLLFAEGSDLPMLLSGPRTGAAALASARTRVTEADAVQIRRLLARQDVVDSIEYRGHEAIAVATPIVGSSWFLVAKIDRDEAFPPWSSAPFSLLLNAIGIGGIVAISAAAIWHRSDARNLAIMLQVESDRMRSDQRYAATLRSVGDAVVSTDDEGRIEYMNPVAERLTGYEREEALGRPLDDLLEFVEESTGESVVSPLRALAPGDAPRPGRLLLRTRDADLRAVALRTAPIRDDQGSVAGLVTVLHDQTDERATIRALIASEARFRSLVETAPVAIFVQTDYRFTYVNASAVRLFGAECSEELLGTSVMPRFHPLYQGLIGEQVSVLETTGNPATPAEAVWQRLDGSAVPAEVCSIPLRYEGSESILVFARDVSERKASEEELELYRNHLEELVFERTKDLAEANSELEKATKAKSAFLAAMSHELRTPLNSIIGFSSILSQGMSGPLTDDQQSQVETIHRSGRHLLELIEDVLDLSKVEAGKENVDITSFDPNDVLDEVHNMLIPLAEAKGLRFAIMRSPDCSPLASDVGKVRQILLNLIGNAIKFTSAGAVSVSLDRDGERSAFSVIDTGPGIAPADLPRVFEAFTQIDTPGRVKVQGTGLGLSLSREYAEMLGGTITAASVVGEGSEFIFTIPNGVTSQDPEPV